MYGMMVRGKVFQMTDARNETFRAIVAIIATGCGGEE